jgi:hypothetical protein
MLLAHRSTHTSAVLLLVGACGRARSLVELGPFSQDCSQVVDCHAQIATVKVQGTLIYKPHV